MATNKRGGSKSGSSRTRTNNPKGRNQYSGMMGTARQNPLATAAAVGGAVAAGVFLWSRRNQISEQIGSLAEQVTGEDGVTVGPVGDERTQGEIAEEALTLKQTGETAA